MRILLIGEYSRLHYTLSEGLRTLGHEVIVASDGDLFKNYPRDVDLTRNGSGLFDTLACAATTLRKFSAFRGYDVVQLINPCFVTMNVRFCYYLYRMLKRNNKKVFLGAFGDDSYWVRACMSNKTFKYSEFFVNGESTNLGYNKKLINRWIDSPRENINKKIAASVDGIAACLYEYFESYKPHFAEKLRYIPLPINLENIDYQPIVETPERVTFFIGINKDRSEYKGTDIMDKALSRLRLKYPDLTRIIRAESVSYERYTALMSQSHIVLDQLYSHSPAMNALLAMAQGKIVVSGGEPEIYELIGETDNHPIINVFPSEDDVFEKLEYLVLKKEKLVQLSQDGRQFVEKHHNHINIASQYVKFWNEK